jgi:beta-galactosidase
MGNSLGNFRKYWDAFYKYPRLQGGFTWDWVDQGLRSKDKNGLEYWNVVNYIDGANADDGLINPDRIPQPEINEAKKVMQNITAKDADLSKGEIRVFNGNYFKDLSDVSMYWEIMSNGLPVHSGKVAELNVRPQDSALVKIPAEAKGCLPGSDCYLNISFQLKHSVLWAPEGFEVAKEQFRISSPQQTAEEAVDSPSESIKLITEDKIIISSPTFRSEIDQKTGQLASLNYLGSELLTQPLKPCFWRVPTDNDEGGMIFSFAARWRLAGLDSFNINVRDIQTDLSKEGILTVKSDCQLVFKSGAIDFITVYTFKSYGETDIRITCSVPGALPPLARVGMEFAMPASFNRISWMGRGPFESYEDRKESAFFGLYSGRVADQHFPYVMPQETGNKTDVSWMKILGLNRGLEIRGNLLNVNVQDYSQEELNKAKTSHVLNRGNNTRVHVDYRQMGLGGDDSWSPRVHPEYQLKAKSYTFGFTLKPY